MGLKAAALRVPKKTKKAAGAGSSTAAVAEKAKRKIACNWSKSTIRESRLEELEELGLLPAKSEISWRAPDEDEARPQPDQGEVVIFADHVTRGFRPPGSLFFRQILEYFKIRPQDIAPNSVLNISHFVVLCKAYLGIEPNLPLFLEFFYCKPQRENSDGPLVIYGGVTIQRQRNIIFPDVVLNSHPKDWQKTWFYCKVATPPGEPPLPGFSVDRLTMNDNMNSFAPRKDRKALEPLVCRVCALLAHGLTGTDLIKCWMGWHIQPLAVRPGLMCQYSGSLEDPMRFNQQQHTDAVLVKAIRKIVNESPDDLSKDGLPPFSALNPVKPASDPWWAATLMASPGSGDESEEDQPEADVEGAGPEASVEEEEEDTTIPSSDPAPPAPKRKLRSNAAKEQTELRRQRRRLRSSDSDEPLNEDSSDSSSDPFGDFAVNEGARAAPASVPTPPRSVDKSATHDEGDVDKPESPLVSLSSQDGQAADPPEVEVIGSKQGEKPAGSRIARATEPKTTPAKPSAGKAPMQSSGFQSYKDLDFSSLFGEFERRISEHRKAEDSVIAELHDKFQDQARHHDHALKVVKEELRAEAGKRAEFEAKIAELQQKLGQAVEENTQLQQDREEHEALWTEERAKLQEDLKASTAKFDKLVAFITEMVTSLFGAWNAICQLEPEMKLKVAYTLVQQLYYGACKAMMACHGWEKPPTTQLKFLEALNMLPGWIESWKRSAARRSAMRVLALAKSYYPALDTGVLTRGWPSLKNDGSPFTKEDLAAIDDSIRHHCTQLTEKMSLSSFQPGFSADGKKLYPKDPAVTKMDPSYQAPLPVDDPAAGSTSVPASARPAAEDEQLPSLFQICWEDAEGVSKKSSKKKSSASGSSTLAPKTSAVPSETGPAV